MRGNNKPGKSGYFGVYWHEEGKAWVAQIRIGKKTQYIGLFPSKLDAAKAFDKASFGLRGQNANLNFPEDFDQ